MGQSGTPTGHEGRESRLKTGVRDNVARGAVLWALGLGMTVVFITPLGYNVPVPTNNPFFKCVSSLAESCWAYALYSRQLQC